MYLFGCEFFAVKNCLKSMTHRHQQTSSQVMLRQACTGVIVSYFLSLGLGVQKGNT